MDDITHESLIIAISIIAINLNVLWLISLLRKHGEKSAFEITLLSLAFGDLTLALSQVAIGTLDILALKGKSTKTMDAAFDYIGHVSSTAINSSFLHIVFIAGQRFVATLYPFRFKQIFTRMICACILIGIWLVSIIITVLRARENNDGDNWFGYLWVPCEVIVALLYAIICYHVFSKRRQFVTSRDEISRQNRKILCLSLIITIAFLVCTLPDVLVVFGTVSINSNNPVNILPFAHAMLNPLICLLFNYLRARGSICCSVRHRNNQIVHFSNDDVTHLTAGGNRIATITVDPSQQNPDQ